MSYLNQLKLLMQRHNLSPNHLLGQNFLIDKNILEKILAAGEIKNSDSILEIGPGLGFLTSALAQRAGRILAVEKDKNFVEILKKEFKDAKNVEIIQGDILQLFDQTIKQLNDYKIIANIPYYLTSRLIKNLLETKNRPQKIVLTIQKEVAQRICAAPPKMSLLALSVQFYAEPKIISYVSKKSFWPPPKIDSAILKITPFKENRKIPAEKFFKLIHAGFSAPRKQIFGNLKKKLEIPTNKILEALKDSGIEPNQRAESLSMEDWFQLIENLSKP